MDTFFNPRGIAVFGVSPSPKNVARTILQNLIAHKYPGTFVGIGSKKTEWSGVTIYPSILAVPEAVDLAVLVIPARSIIPALEECREAGIERAVIMTAGFKELEGEEDQLSADLIKAAGDLGIRFIGPNCQGVIHTRSGVCLPFFSMPPDRLKPGTISVLSQSGTIALITSLYLSHELAGVNKMVSMGNKMNVDEVDLMAYLLNDQTTDIIVLHLESTERGRELFELLACCPKPVILYKTQVCPESKTVAFSHTAALADDDNIIEGAAWQSGILRAKTFREVIEIAKALSLKPIRGNRLGMVVASGGVGIAAVDACTHAGMELASLPQTCLDEISSFSKAKVINLTNPVDTGTIYDNRVNVKALEMIMSLEQVDGGILTQFHSRTGDYFEQIPDQLVIRETANLSHKMGKPIALHFLCDPHTREELKAETSYPIFDTVEDAVNALSTLWRFHQGRQRAQNWIEPLEAVNRAQFLFDCQGSCDLQGFSLISTYGIPVEQPIPATSEEELFAQADVLGYPVALKALSPDFTHKLFAGAVMLNLGSREELEEAAQRMKRNLAERAARVSTFLVQKMVPAGTDLMFGGKRDPHYGPVVLVGFGGTEVEQLKTAICCLAPVSPGMAGEMIDTLSGRPENLSSYREALAGTLSRFSQLLVDNAAIQEIDLNPVRLLPEQRLFTVLDVRVRLSAPDR